MQESRETKRGNIFLLRDQYRALKQGNVFFGIRDAVCTTSFQNGKQLQFGKTMIAYENLNLERKGDCESEQLSWFGKVMNT